MDKKIMWILIGVGIILGLVGGVTAYSYFSSGNNVDRKPALYLYPEEDSWVKVTLRTEGKIILDIPEYKGGWEVFATKEGVIDGRYDYLYYEIELGDIPSQEEGWVVAQEDLYGWFDEHLPLLGLNEKERLQFKEYWVYRLMESDFYQISLLPQVYLEDAVGIKVEPEPDTMIRLIFVFTPLEEARYLPEPEIVTPVREGFTVVEWGGILKDS